MYPLRSPESKELQKLLFMKNNIIPDEIWLTASEKALQEKFLHEYGQQLEKDMMHHLVPLVLDSDDSSSTQEYSGGYQHSIFQDLQDPYYFSVLSLSHVDEEIMRPTTWRQ